MAKSHAWWKLWSARRAQSRREQRYHVAWIEQLEERSLLSVTLLNLPTQVTVNAGAALPIALTSQSTSPVFYTVESSNGDVLQTIVTSQTNKTLRLEVAGYGTLDLELFDDLAPQTAARMEELVNQGYFNGKPFHRIIDNFMIQGGGNGSSGEIIPDEFNPLLRFTSSGILAMANAGADTNDAQFFITDVPTRWLDFQHSIYGFLTAGDSVRNEINHNTTGTPIITSATIIDDPYSSVAFLSIPTLPSSTDPLSVTVRATNLEGETATSVITVTPQADVAPDSNADGQPDYNVDARPFIDLNSINGGAIRLTQNAAATQVSIPAINLDGASVYYSLLTGRTSYGTTIPATSSNLTASIDHQTGQLTITPNAGATGYGWVRVALKDDNGLGDSDFVINNSENSTLWTTKYIPVIINPAAPTGVTMVSPSDDPGAAVTSLTNADSSKTLQFAVDGVISGATVKLFADGREIGSAVASGTSVTITTNGTLELTGGPHVITAQQTLTAAPVTSVAWVYPSNSQSGSLTSGVSPTLALTVNSANTKPVFTSTPPAVAAVGRVYYYAPTANRGNVVFSVSGGAPDNNFFVDNNGSVPVIQWLVPDNGSASQTYDVVIKAADADDPTIFTTQSYTLTVAHEPGFSALIPAQSVAQGWLYMAQAQGEGTAPLTYSLQGAPAGMKIDPETGVITWTPGRNQATGEYVPAVVVTDANGLTNQADFVINVTPTKEHVNSTPVLAPIADQTVTAGVLLKVPLGVSDADLPNDTLHYEVSGPSGGQVITNGDGTVEFQWTPGAGNVGDNAVTILVVDAEGAIAQQSFTITVNAAPNDDPPVFDTSVTDSSVEATAGTTALLRAYAADTDGIDKIQYSVEGLPANIAALPAAQQPRFADALVGTLTWAIPASLGEQTVNFAVRATEVATNGSSNLSATWNMSIVVHAAPIVIPPPTDPTQPGGPTTPSSLAAAAFDLAGGNAIRTINPAATALSDALAGGLGATTTLASGFATLTAGSSLVNYGWSTSTVAPQSVPWAEPSVLPQSESLGTSAVMSEADFIDLLLGGVESLSDSDNALEARKKTPKNDEPTIDDPNKRPDQRLRTGGQGSDARAPQEEQLTRDGRPAADALTQALEELADEILAAGHELLNRLS